MPDMPWRFLRVWSRRSLARGADLHVAGIEHLPADGPALLVVRHVHHQRDGEALLAAIERPVHLVVAIDWPTNRATRSALAAACRWARWPTVIRPESALGANRANARRCNARAMREAVELLDEGRLVAVFPEAYPDIDNNPRPDTLPAGALPFRSGFERLERLANQGGKQTPIVPVGISFEPGERARISLRFGAAIHRRGLDDDALRRTVEAEVRRLSEG